MLNKNYKVEKGFIADLPASRQAGARTMMAQEPLYEIVQWNPEKVRRYFGADLPQDVAQRAREKMILTRITYFNPQTLTAEDLQLLLSLARKTFGRTDISIQELAASCQTSYPVFSNWLVMAVKLLPVARRMKTLVVQDYPNSDINWCR